MFNFRLSEILTAHNITKNTLAREAKVRPNVVYEMCDNKTQRIELKTLGKLLRTLTELTGKQINVGDVLEYILEDNEEDRH